MTQDEQFEQVKKIVESAMWSARRYGHDDEGIDGFEDDWEYEVDHFAQEIMGVLP